MDFDGPALSCFLFFFFVSHVQLRCDLSPSYSGRLLSAFMDSPSGTISQYKTVPLEVAFGFGTLSQL